MIKKASTIPCPYCGGEARLEHSEIVYPGRNYGYVYLCKPCDAYVDCHRFTSVAKGTPAKKKLRKLRKLAHDSFNKLWRHGVMTCADAYKWLESEFGQETHIGTSNEEMCEKIIAKVKEKK